MVAGDEPLEKRAIKLLNLSSFISHEPLLKLIQENIQFDAIRRSSTALIVMASNWHTGEFDTFTNRDLTDRLGPHIILASQALPGFFEPVQVGARRYVDGAVLGYARFGDAIDAGANNLHVIYLDPDIRLSKTKSNMNAIETIHRMFEITWAERLNASLRMSAKINETQLEMERARLAGKLSESQAEFVRRALLPLNVEKPVPKTTIHRHRPSTDADGPMGTLDLNRERLANLIEQGFDDAVSHDCEQNECVVLDDSETLAEIEAIRETSASRQPM